MKYFIRAIKKYAQFTGRASRQEYWMFVLFQFIFGVVFIILDNLLGLAMEEVGYGPLTGIFILFTMIPSLAVGVRRLHDVGKSGFMMLISLIPLIGGIYLIILMVRKSDQGTNKYGPHPDDPEADRAATYGTALNAEGQTSIGPYIFPTVLIIIGGGLLVLGAVDGQNKWVLLGSGAALMAGVVSLMLIMGAISRSIGMVIGIVFLLGSALLGWRNYRSIQEVQEFTARKEVNDRMVIQGLRDIREAQSGFRQANGAYTNDLGTLRQFVRSGTIPMVRAIGQVPDTLTEVQALEMGIIVRDTIQAPAVDSLFMKPAQMAGRAYPFDPARFGVQPVSGRDYILRAGMIQSSGRNVPVFIAKDPDPMIAGDTLMVGSLEKATTVGNWPGQ